jgi:hypothetical protein
MTPNQKLSESLSLLATLDPASVAVGTVSTGWVNVGNHAALMALIGTGVNGTGATIDANIQQAASAAGAGAKAVTGKSITQIQQSVSGNNKQAIINFKTEDLDTTNGFCYVNITVTVGVAASIVGAALFGGFARFSDAATFNQAAVLTVN